VVETVECIGWHELFAFRSLVQCRPYRLDLAADALALGLEQRQVRAQRGRGVALAVEDLADRAEPEAELAQQQDPLQRTRLSSS
jgi:hypothetical protein